MPKTSKTPVKKKALPPEREHVIQIPLMDGCFLCLQINNMIGGSWTLGFPKDKVTYPITNELAQTLGTLAANRVPGGWLRRNLSDEEVKFLQDRSDELSSCDCPNEIQELLASKGSVDHFVSDVQAVWNEREPSIVRMVSKLNDTVVAGQIPMLDAILSLIITALLGAATIGASAPHLVGLVMQVAKVVHMHVEKIPIQPGTGESN